MVGRDVEPDRDVGAEALEQLELVGRQLQHIDAVVAERRQIEHAAADIAADLAAPAGLVEDVADQGRRGRLAVGAGYTDEPRLRLRAGQKLDVADDLLAGRARRRRHGMGLGQTARNAGTDDECRHARPIDGRRLDDGDAGLGRRLARSGIVVPGDKVDPGGLERSRGRQAGARQPQHDERRTLQHAKIDHGLTGASRWRGRPSPGWRR